MYDARAFYVPAVRTPNPNPGEETAKSVKKLRWFLFSKKQCADETLPPTRAALKQINYKRANYVGDIKGELSRVF